MAYTLIFLLTQCEWHLHLQTLLSFFSKNNCELDIVLTRTVNILTTNELVKLTMLWTKKGKRKVQGVPQSEAAAHPRQEGEVETDKKTKQAQIERTKSTKISSLIPKRGNRNAKRTDKYKNKITQGKT